MEFPNLGKHCSFPICNRLDFLPVKCDACTKIFCHEHMSYEIHGCIEGAMRDVQVPVCPLCNKPVSCPRGIRPDYAVGEHIDNDCQSDPAVGHRRVYAHKCAHKGCKRREMVPVLCETCCLNYCLLHRHPTDHKCPGSPDKIDKAVQKKNAVTTISQARPCQYTSVQGELDEDEALARAIAMSLADEDSGAMSTSASDEENHSGSSSGNNSRANKQCKLS